MAVVARTLDRRGVDGRLLAGMAGSAVLLPEILMPPRKLASWLAARISLARYRGPLPVAASLALSVVSINFCLLWLTGAAPRGFVQAQAYLDWKYFEQAADTVAGLVHAYRASPARRRSRFCSTPA